MAYHDSPCNGYQQPGTTWQMWRSAIFTANTGCQNGNCPPDAEKQTGYFTKFIPFQYFGTMQPVTLRQLYSHSNPCKEGNTLAGATSFCNNLLYANGDPVPPAQRPFCCGGNGPNFSNYNVANYAINELQPWIDDKQKQFVDDTVRGFDFTVNVWATVVIVLAVLFIFRFIL